MLAKVDRRRRSCLSILSIVKAISSNADTTSKTFEGQRHLS